jgi:CrcB protein
MTTIAIIGLGGFLGAISRFMVAKYTADMFGPFPLGTLLVNVTGSFLLAFISYSVLNGKDISPEVRSFINIGFIGAYTTMSTFSFETMRFLDKGEYGFFALNIILNLGLCLGAIVLGRYAALLIK